MADHDPAQEVREEHHSLVGLGHKLLGDLVHHNGEGHGDDGAQDDEDHVIQQRIPNGYPGCIRLEQEFEVLEANPLGADQIAPEAWIPWIDLVVLECQNDTAHGQVPQEQQPNGCGGDHGQQDQRFLPLGEAAGLLQGLGAGNGFGIAAHKSTSFPLVFILTKLAFMCFAFLTILY